MTCPTLELIHLLGSRWPFSIVHVLGCGPLRYQALLQALPGISTRTLTDRLRDLEAMAAIRRQVFAEVPPRVEYRLASLGLELEAALSELERVALKVRDRNPRSLKAAARESSRCPKCDASPVIRRPPSKSAGTRAARAVPRGSTAGPRPAKSLPPPPLPPEPAPMPEERRDRTPWSSPSLPSFDDVVLL